MSERVVTFQKWMLENKDFLDNLGRYAAERIANSILELLSSNSIAPLTKKFDQQKMENDL